MRDFIAWATAVIGGYRPFTAFFRVLDQKQAELALESKGPSLGKLENAFAGLIIGETLTLSTNQRSVSTLSLLPCQSTYSYSFARAFALGHAQRGNTADPISAPLTLARRLTRQPARKLGDELLPTALKVAVGLAGGAVTPSYPNVPGFLWEACRELQSQGEVNRSWHLLEGRVASAGHLLDEMRGPREQRVRTFERVLKQPDQLDILTSSFLAGLLADQIAPGTFEHIDLLLPYLNHYPMALVWYGLCAGLHPDSEVQEVGNCLGRRLVRDLLVPDPIISRPRYDISVSELEVYLDREAPIEFRVASQNHIAVELLPGVPAYMKWPAIPSTEPTLAQPRELPPQAHRLQPELPWRPSPAERMSDDRGSPSERRSAVRELQKAVDRVRLILDEPSRDEDTKPTDEGSGRKRRKGR
jgi:hypothetical protein